MEGKDYELLRTSDSKVNKSNYSNSNTNSDILPEETFLSVPPVYA